MPTATQLHLTVLIIPHSQPVAKYRQQEAVGAEVLAGQSQKMLIIFLVALAAVREVMEPLAEVVVVLHLYPIWVMDALRIPARAGLVHHFVGGVGGGGATNIIGTDGTVIYGGAGAANGGAGGYGATNGDDLTAAYGGAGNPNGGDAPGSYCTPHHNMSGAGGLLIITVLGYLYIASGAIISSNGSSGGYGINSNDGLVYGAGGAGSGGGSVNILYSTYTNNGTLQANGGAGGVGRFNSVGDANGGAGGAGSVRANSLRTT